MPRPTAPPLALPRDAPGRPFERTDNHHGGGKNYVDKSTPINSAVTGLNFPTPYTERPPAPEPFSTPQGSSDGSFDAPLTPPDFESLDQLWDSLRHEKELKEAKSRPKVKSLEGPDHFPPPPRANAPVRPAAPVVENTKQVLKKKSSHCTFRESPDGTTVTAIFDLPGIKKQDVHISYQRNRLVVTWQTVHVTEREEDGRLVRESKENKESRTIPLPEGTKFEEVHANMDRRLTLTYPNMRSVRAHARPKAQGTSSRPQPS